MSGAISPPSPLPLPGRRLAAVGLVLAVLVWHGWLLGRLSEAGALGAHRRAPVMVVVRPTRHDAAARVQADARSRWALDASPVAAPEPLTHRPAPQAVPAAPAPGSQPVQHLAKGSPADDEPAPRPAPAEPDRSEGEADAESVGVPDAQAQPVPPPVYPTVVPDPVRRSYQLRMGVGAGVRGGEATLDWWHDGHEFRFELDGADRGAPLIRQRSQGGFDAAGVAPERFTDQRRGRGLRSVNFQRERGRIRFSGPRIEYPAWPGAQDRLSWIAQLAAIAQAAGGVSHDVSLFVVDARGAGGLWTFRPQGHEPISMGMGSVVTVRLLREPQHPIDWRVEAWLDPGQGFWPVRLRMSLPRSGAVLELTPVGELAP